MFRAALLGAALLFASPALASPYKSCSGPTRITSNSSIQLFDTHGYSTPVAAWMRIIAAGAGTPTAIVKIYAPAPDGSTGDTSVRAVARLCTLSASITYCSIQTNVEAVDITVSGCTGCSLDVTVCGTNNAGRQ